MIGAISNLSEKILFHVADRNNKASFLEFLAKLVDMPLSKSNAVVVLDNATYHRGFNITNYLTERGIGVLFMPPSSSELNPIELCWSHVKRRLTQ